VPLYFCNLYLFTQPNALRFIRRRELSSCFFDHGSEGCDVTILDTAELTIPGLVDKARFKEEAVPGKSGLLVGPEVVHLAPDELAVLTDA